MKKSSCNRKKGLIGFENPQNFINYQYEIFISLPYLG